MLNQLEKRREFWIEVRNLNVNSSEVRCLTGDFHNVLGSNDRIGGNPVLVNEF